MAEQRRARRALEDDEIALVCDVGGGTTDFSLIRVRIEAGAPAFERMAIGDHLLLGGDNLDLALATLVERRIAEARPAMRLAITQRVGAPPAVQRGQGTDARRRRRPTACRSRSSAPAGRSSATR